jgi:hypothetical protein
MVAHRNVSGCIDRERYARRTSKDSKLVHRNTLRSAATSVRASNSQSLHNYFWLCTNAAFIQRSRVVARGEAKSAAMALLTIFLLAQSFFGTLPIDGIRCDRQEGAVEHVHTSLQLYNRGHVVTVPADIGISQAANCLYWIHTHDTSGLIHIESPVKRTFKLGQFFDIWGPDLSWTTAASVSAPHGRRLSIWVNGKPWHGSDPRAIVLQDRETIVIQSGPPFSNPVPVDWSKF